MPDKQPSITSEDKQQFRNVVNLPGFPTMDAAGQRNALRTVGVFKSAPDSVLDQVLGAVRTKIGDRFNTAPPPIMGANIQPVSKLEGIRQSYGNALKQDLQPPPTMPGTWTVENGKMVRAKNPPAPDASHKMSQFEYGFSKGMIDVGVDLTSPTNLAMMAASFLKAPKLAAKFPKIYALAKAAVKGTFSVQMLGSVLDEIPEAKKAFDEGDYVAAGQAVAKGLVDLQMLGALHKDTPGKLAESGRAGMAKLREAAPKAGEFMGKQVDRFRGPRGISPPVTLGEYKGSATEPAKATPPPPAEPKPAPTPAPQPPNPPAAPQAPGQGGLFEQPETPTAKPGATPRPPVEGNTPEANRARLESVATDTWGESLGGEYMKAVEAGDTATMKQFEDMLPPEQLAPILRAQRDWLA